MSEDRKTGMEQDLEALDEVEAGRQAVEEASADHAKPEHKTGLEQDLEALDEKD